MAHIGRQHRELGLEISPVAITLRQTVQGTGEPQMTESGPLAASAMRNATHPEEMTEDAVDRAAIIGATLRGGKKDRLGRSAADDGDILPQTLGERRGQRHQTVLAEL